MGSEEQLVLDCAAGRRMGCATYCCRLIVRLGPNEQDPLDPRREKSCVDKDRTTGLCIHLDPERELCRIWEQRPQACREFDCNQDYRLQVVLERGYSNLVQLSTAKPPSNKAVRRVPYLSRSS